MIYVSTPVAEVDHELLQSILDTAERKNTARDLTGLLLFDDKHFLQVIEGGRAAVSSLLGSLCKDSRHKNLVVIGFDTISQRSFPTWAMQFVPMTGVTREVMLRYGATGRFDPYALTKEGAHALLLEMAERV